MKEIVARRLIAKKAPPSDKWDTIDIKDVLHFGKYANKEPFRSAAAEIKKLKRDKNVTLIRAYWGKGELNQKIRVVSV